MTPFSGRNDTSPIAHCGTLDCRAAAPRSGSLLEVTKIKMHSGTVDDAIEYLVLHGGSQAAAARAKDCDPSALCRTIQRLQDVDAWDDLG